MNLSIFLYELEKSVKNYKFLIILFIYFGLLFLLLYGSVGLEDVFTQFEATDFLTTSYGDYFFGLPFAFTVFLIPFLFLFTSSDSLAMQIRYKYLQYIVTKTSRLNIYFSKLFSDYFVNCTAILIGFLTSFLYLFFFFDFVLLDFHRAFIIPFISLVIYSLVITSLYQLINVLGWSSSKILVTQISSLLLMIILLSSQYLRYLSIFYYLPDIDLDPLLTIYIKLSVLLTWAILFMLIGYKFFKRKDL